VTIQFLKPFIKDYAKLPVLQRQKVDRQLELLKKGLKHPGMNVRKMVGRDIWEARIDYHYRMTFVVKGDVLQIRRVGTHEIYRKP
jgi:mRNA-degrading endonuclease YafQ of YafQ-DinJ toxin-antitoxin module